MSDKLSDLLEFVKSENRICPNPQEWQVLWEMLPDKKQVGLGWEPPTPLILAAWWEAPALSKIVRLAEHIQYAAEHGALDGVDTYLRGLKPEQWFYMSEEKRRL
ncbi:MAG: hypothetical protein JXB85_11770 [Anaerolineales bacterium]|nr:hypothetical protein [Anaerolineales bacterium]